MEGDCSSTYIITGTYVAASLLLKTSYMFWLKGHTESPAYSEPLARGTCVHVHQLLRRSI